MKSLLFENLKLPSSKDSRNNINKFYNKPKCIILQDTFNNPFFPIKQNIILDTFKSDISSIFKRYRQLYSKEYSIFLPWHYIVETIDDEYIIYNTRPLDMKFPLNNYEAENRRDDNNDIIKWNEDTNNFFTNNIYDISDGIHICIIGDSNLDVYVKRI